MSSFDHSLDADIEFHPGVPVRAALYALEPVSAARAWPLVSPPCISTPFRTRDGERFSVTVGDDGCVRRIVLHTEGEIFGTFDASVERAAARLATLARPGCFELVNYDSGRRDPIDRCWYGEPAAVAIARQVHACHEAAAALACVPQGEALADLLRRIAAHLAAGHPLAALLWLDPVRRDDAEDALGQLAQALGDAANGPAAAALASLRALLSGSAPMPDGGPGAARQLLAELTCAYPTLDAIDLLRGAGTLALCMRLQGAILEHGRLECAPAQHSNLRLTLARLPSATRWHRFVVCA